MKVLSFQPLTLKEEDRRHIRTVFQNGGVIVFPSDTAYGLAADPQKSEAVEKIYKIKGLTREKAISCIFASFRDAKKWAHISPQNEKVLKAHLPGAFTFILPRTERFPLRGDVGVRVPDSNFTDVLLEILSIPYTATSANISGSPSLYKVEDIIREFEKNKDQPDLILDAGPLLAGSISTVVDLRFDQQKIIREGSGRFLPVGKFS